MSSLNTPTADLHTPEELIDNAETLFASDNLKMMRAAVLEAITALEAFVHITVFSSLDQKLDPLLVRWLKDKTKMDFDSRLSVLTSVAMGRSIEKDSELWSDYKRAKEIRNKVTHSGAKVSSTDARFVIDTVYKWLAYLGSTVELEVALIYLKRYIEETKRPVTSEKEAVSLIEEYFGRTKAAASLPQVSFSKGRRQLRADLVLKFGPYAILIETKFSRGRATKNLIENAVEQVNDLMNISNIPRSAVVIFQTGELQPGFEDILKYQNGKIYVVVIQV